MNKVTKAWHHGGHANSGSHWTDGTHIWSYTTCILAPLDPESPGTAPFILNLTHYSPTTRKHQEATRADVPSAGLIILDNVPRDAGPDQLRELAKEEVSA